jgi:3-hydroxymyristoyl/3-hydroxydecanoyl-(acyl carrier protein) dehydratase
VVILDEVVSALLQAERAYLLCAVPLVKFTAPLLPGQAFFIDFGVRSGDWLKFWCTLRDGQVVAQGQLQVATRP